jgi:hypothetical protein
MGGNNRETLLEYINKSRELLRYALDILEEENQDGKQFDYVNSPKLSDSYDALERTVKSIGKIVYQE